MALGGTQIRISPDTKAVADVLLVGLGHHLRVSLLLGVVVVLRAGSHVAELLLVAGRLLAGLLANEFVELDFSLRLAALLIVVPGVEGLLVRV